MSNPQNEEQNDQIESDDTAVMSDHTDAEPATSGHSDADSQTQRNIDDESPS